jgi:hypothetical protein
LVRAAKAKSGLTTCNVCDALARALARPDRDAVALLLFQHELEKAPLDQREELTTLLQQRREHTAGGEYYGSPVCTMREMRASNSNAIPLILALCPPGEIDKFGDSVFLAVQSALDRGDDDTSRMLIGTHIDLLLALTDCSEFIVLFLFVVAAGRVDVAHFILHDLPAFRIEDREDRDIFVITGAKMEFPDTPQSDAVVRRLYAVARELWRPDEAQIFVILVLGCPVVMMELAAEYGCEGIASIVAKYAFRDDWTRSDARRRLAAATSVARARGHDDVVIVLREMAAGFARVSLNVHAAPYVPSFLAAARA